MCIENTFFSMHHGIDTMTPFPQEELLELYSLSTVILPFFTPSHHC